MWLVSLFPFLNIYIKEKNSYFFQINPCACCLPASFICPAPHGDVGDATGGSRVTPRGGSRGTPRGHLRSVGRRRSKEKKKKKPHFDDFCFSFLHGCCWGTPSPLPPPTTLPRGFPDSLFTRFFFFFLSFCLLLKVSLNTGRSCAAQGSNQRNQTTCASAQRNSTKKTNQRNH